MFQWKKKILDHISSKGRGTKELVKSHVSGAKFNEALQRTTITVDNRHVMNLLESHQHSDTFVSAVRGTFGEDVSVVIRTAHPHHAHDREMLVPRAIHFR